MRKARRTYTTGLRSLYDYRPNQHVNIHPSTHNSPVVKYSQQFETEYWSLLILHSGRKSSEKQGECRSDWLGILLTRKMWTLTIRREVFSHGMMRNDWVSLCYRSLSQRITHPDTAGFHRHFPPSVMAMYMIYTKSKSQLPSYFDHSHCTLFCVTMIHRFCTKAMKLPVHVYKVFIWTSYLISGPR